MRHAVALSLLLLAVTPACGDDDGPSTPGPDTGPGPDVVEPDAGPEPDASTDDAEIDLGPPIVASTAHCNYEPTPANANATGPLDDGTLTAGVADVPIGLPVGSALGAYTARASFLGESVTVDRRFVEISGAFVPSIGIETTPRIKVLALTAGSETLLLVKADLGMTDENVVFDVAERLGPDYRGKVVITASHSHSSFGHFSTTSALGVGFGRFRQRSYDHLVTRIVEACQSALAARSPARIGIHHEPDFDPDDVVSHDRRDQNDDLPNGANRKDHDLFVIRVDTADGAPMALLPMFGVHGIISDFDNPYASTDAPGAMERVLEETFDRPVLVMHLQGAAGDVSPGGRGGIDCSGDLGCPAFARGESVGHLAVEP
ncbi:MAG: neutral/alkaline non-lysosomal ceramidase N-terminal domain-containing protein, partial [Deltaproteobacteria bacterium]|nr:neutral/alkaline non-lysosomal ceramidase N-terminal domain-containing protein [Deltaproteobacteria bacterium]